jgi:hypothetical protein
VRALLDALAALALAVLLVWSAWLIIAVLAVLAVLGAVTGAYGVSLVRRPRHRACPLPIADLADPATLLPWEDPPPPLGDIGDGMVVPDRLDEPRTDWPSVEDTRRVLRALLEPAGTQDQAGPDRGRAQDPGAGRPPADRTPGCRPGPQGPNAADLRYIQQGVRESVRQPAGQARVTSDVQQDRAKAAR